MFKLGLKTILLLTVVTWLFVPYSAMAVTGANLNDTGGNAGATGAASPGNEGNAAQSAGDTMDAGKTGTGPRGTKVAPSTSPAQPTDRATGGESSSTK
jgi:hypothetical protein